ncbi:MAG: flagellar export chaperone FlgN [Pseudomonadota bacterium]|jgi:flagella synthesis protein FlgN|uniref:Flagellar biosynthesis protein FlgN n=1 Tax=Alteromonas alba TaxID=2079529 RepID=A0A2S9V9D6_9ALTE|nr:flagellar export chaperone FlgN [Alteromonas alba]MCP4865906.1 flagellar protein FlgN [Alteromonas sp.]MDY6928344.1 flagellar export chaperone FlgN [Pseudomonadota bacterium]PRO73043.1 flagellar biosynthesis protein FlgN [Alteromonas alba]
MTATLIDQLKLQTQQLSSFKAMLDKELHLIGSRDAEALMTLLHDKEALLSAIQNLDETVNPQLAALQQDAPLSDEILALIEQSKTLLIECQYCTEVNQRAIEQGQLRLAHLRNLMMDIRAKESLTYDKAGKKKGGFSGKGVSA